jgi:hypothetical protein
LPEGVAIVADRTAGVRELDLRMSCPGAAGHYQK